MKLVLTRRVRDYLLNTEAATYPAADPEGADLIKIVRAAKPRYDGSTLVKVEEPLIMVLLDYAETMESEAQQMTKDPEGLAELSAARALLRHLTKDL